LVAEFYFISIDHKYFFTVAENNFTHGRACPSHKRCQTLGYHVGTIADVIGERMAQESLSLKQLKSLLHWRFYCMS